MTNINSNIDPYRFQFGVPPSLCCTVQELLARFDEHDQQEAKTREHTTEVGTHGPHFGVYEQHRKFILWIDFRVTGRRFLPDGLIVSETWSSSWRNGETAAGKHHFNNDRFSVTRPERRDMGAVGRWTP